MSTFTRFAAIAAAASLLLGACGDDKKADSTTTTAAASAASSSTSAAPSSSDAPTAAKKIISLSPSATETLFAIGAGDQVIAVDDQSNYPAEATKLPHDLSGFQPNVEAIAALKPEVVIHDGTTDLKAQLDKVGIESFIDDAPKAITDVYARIEQLGALTGHTGDAAELVSKMTSEIDAAVKAAPKGTGMSYFHELDNTLYSVTSSSFIGQVYALFGLTNVADALAGGSPYPQLSAEAVITANPDLIFLADGGFGESAQTVSARPGWAAIAAVKNGAVFTVDADIASRWGPRLSQSVQFVADALAKVPAKVG